METLYWITRLDNIHTLFLALSVILAFFIVIIGVCFVLDDSDDGSNKVFFKRLLRPLSILFTVCVFGEIFIPTTNECLVIYGEGKIIDYLNDNPNVKQMPDKFIKITDLYLQKLDNDLPKELNLVDTLETNQ